MGFGFSVRVWEIGYMNRLKGLGEKNEGYDLYGI